MRRVIKILSCTPGMTILIYSMAFFVFISCKPAKQRAFVAADEPMAGQIIVDPQNPSWLKYKEGGGVFLSGPGDPEGFLYRGSRNPDGTRNGDQMKLINKLKDTGANSIYLMAVRSHGGDAVKDPEDPADPRFQNPFVDGEHSKGIDDDILDQWDKWFTVMNDNKIVVFFFFYDDGARIWNTGDRVGEQERKFIRSIVDRFEHHKYIIWAVAEEYDEVYSAKRVSNIAAEIKAADDYDHVVSVHKLPGLDFSEFAEDPSIDQFAIQYNVTAASELHKGMVNAWKKSAGRYNLNMAEVAYGKIGVGTEARMKSWAIAMGGAYVMINGMDIISTPVSDLKDMGHIVRFFESTNFNEMAPHDELKYGGTEYVLALAGDSYIAYASDLSGNIGIKNMIPGTYSFRWFDIRSGNTVDQKDVHVSSGNHIWNRPDGINRELAVYIKIYQRR